MIDPYLPHETETEARLLSAALIALPDVRAEILDQVSRSDFFDHWHRWFYDALVSGHGLDMGELIDHLYSRQRTDGHKLGFWIGRLLIDFDDSSKAGIVDNWPVYAAEIRKLTERRIKILRLMAELEEACG